MNKIIIALSGYKGSGKSTVAEHLVDNHDFIELSFAEALKDSVAEQYGLERSHLDDQKFKNKPLKQYPMETESIDVVHYGGVLVNGEMYWTPRGLTIYEGWVKRRINPNWWINKLLDALYLINKPICVSDVRYPNELFALQETGYLVDYWKIDRGLSETCANEKHVDTLEPNKIIHNTKGLVELHQEIDSALSKIL